MFKGEVVTMSLSIRQRKYKMHRLKGLSKRASGIAAGYSLSYVNKMSKVEEKIDFVTMLETQGLTDRKLAKTIVDGMQACKFSATPDENGNFETPDWQTRHKYLETALKLTNKLETINNNTFIDQSSHSHVTYSWKTGEEGVSNEAKGNTNRLSATGISKDDSL